MTPELLQRILAWVQRLCAWGIEEATRIEKTAPPRFPAPLMDPLTHMAICIRDYEGKPGERNYRNNNPGNCRYSSVGYLPIYEPVGKDKDNFAVFKDYDTGFLYLKNLIKSKVKAHPEWTFYDFFSNYAPSKDNNDPRRYAATVCSRLAVEPSMKVSNVIVIA